MRRPRDKRKGVSGALEIAPRWMQSRRSNPSSMHRATNRRLSRKIARQRFKSFRSLKLSPPTVGCKYSTNCVNLSATCVPFRSPSNGDWLSRSVLTCQTGAISDTSASTAGDATGRRSRPIGRGQHLTAPELITRIHRQQRAGYVLARNHLLL